MRVMLSTYGSRGDVEPLVGLAVRLGELGAEVRVCAPPDEDFAQRLARVGGTNARSRTSCWRSWTRAHQRCTWATTAARAGATSAVAGTVRTDGAVVAANLLLDAISQEKTPVSV